MSKCFGLKVHEKDNVATIFAEVAAGDVVVIADKAGRQSEISAQNDIPYGHKIALVDIPAGEKILKYGEVIGQAGVRIGCGEHVHVHNIDSLRGRGDLAEIKAREVHHEV